MYSLKKIMKLLILTEGSRTEIDYFRALIQHLDCADVSVFPGKSPDPIRLLREAIQYHQSQHCDVWVVLDTEVPGRDRTRDRHLKQALASGARFGIHFALSAPCFEVWLLSHLNEVPKKHSPHRDSAFYAKLLSQKLKYPYRKSDYNLAPFLKDENLQAAMQSPAGKNGLTSLTKLLWALAEKEPYRNGRMSSSESIPSKTINKRSMPTAIPPLSGIPRSKPERKSSSSG